MAKRTKPVLSTLRNTFGTNVRLERTRAKVTLEDLAGDVGTTASYLSRVERGLVAPSLDAVERIAAALKVAPTSLMDETLGRR